MKCIIIAAGYATRLYPLTENFPKPLLKVGKKAILDWLVDDLAETAETVETAEASAAAQAKGPADELAGSADEAAGLATGAAPLIEEFVVVTNHRFYPHFLKWAESKPQKITVLDDHTETNETRLGAVRDIWYAVEQLHIDEDCAVMAGDNVLDFSLQGFLRYAKESGTSCIMCHEENSLEALRKTGVITFDENHLITSYEEKPQEPKGNHAVPPFYYYRAEDLKRIPEALEHGCNFDAPGNFAVWLSAHSPMHAYVMPGKRYDIGDLQSYEHVQEIFA